MELTSAFGVFALIGVEREIRRKSAGRGRTPWWVARVQTMIFWLPAFRLKIPIRPLHRDTNAEIPLRA